MQGPLRFLPVSPNHTCARSHVWGFPKAADGLLMSINQEKPHIHKISACNSGAGNGCACLWAPGIFWFLLLENPPMLIKFLLLKGGGLGFLRRGRGGSANLIFMGVGIFPVQEGPPLTPLVARAIRANRFARIIRN